MDSMWTELTTFLTQSVNKMETYHWMIVAGAMLSLGFLCMRGDGRMS